MGSLSILRVFVQFIKDGVIVTFIVIKRKIAVFLQNFRLTFSQRKRFTFARPNECQSNQQEPRSEERRSVMLCFEFF